MDIKPGKLIISSELDIACLFNEHYSWLCYCAVKATRNTDLARDLVQDFFVYYWVNRKTIKIAGSFKSYATRAVLNIALSYMKRDKMRTQHLSRLPAEEQEDSYYSIESEQAHSSLLNQLFNAINKLSSQKRKILVLHQFGQLKYAEIADKLGLSKNTVKTHLKIAYRILKENLVYKQDECKKIKSSHPFS